MTLVSIVFMHIVCNALRVFLGVLVVALVGELLVKILFLEQFEDLEYVSDNVANLFYIIQSVVDLRRRPEGTMDPP